LRAFPAVDDANRAIDRASWRQLAVDEAFWLREDLFDPHPVIRSQLSLTNFCRPFISAAEEVLSLGPARRRTQKDRETGKVTVFLKIDNDGNAGIF
jgi:hypothetical protein